MIRTFILFTALFVTSFLNATETDKPARRYGSSSANITFNDDHTFQFTESCSGKTVEITGTWEMKSNRIIIHTEGSSPALAKKWKLKNNGGCIKGRNKLAWISLCGTGCK